MVAKHHHPCAVTEGQRDAASASWWTLRTTCRRRQGRLCEGRTPCVFLKCPWIPAWMKSRAGGYTRD